MNIVDRQLPDKKSKNEVSLSAYTLLFSELIQYNQRKVTHIKELERRLADIGYSVGVRLLEYIAWKDKGDKYLKRETNTVRFLQFIAVTVWKLLFGKAATLERSMDKKEQFMITEDSTLVDKFISVPKDMQGLNCASLVGGLVEGLLDAAEFPARVSTHSVSVDTQKTPRTVILIEFNASVLAREQKYSL
eukprot:TRINITY_DN4573_c0_g1_i1.p1 TRINITY_DN4573_c0_g1~~TRINITY_DN4573_c0_g1_i1.p1  ORF type:complete len:211 (-),score=49.77 TRINITY_DN4573_c0_g1_i1:279-848(-)